MIALELLLATLAFALFGFATHEHHRKRLGRPLEPARARRLRVAAWVALAAAFPPAIVSHGWVFGPIEWAGSVMLGAGIIFLALNFLPDRKAQ
ncbi:DUF3325 domain-containing protein [Sphingomonas sp. MG17]|jgi:hypothetical protein|uniref:DUF3325 domain-containing protein n=1 Tax=Sphingomonas tagetis TaxID=2949092 RepID=A0A9X2HS42_9SPHN|nr:DUF3325 family protein [Sphingomonas tagetis]MCP3730890.1 DUF3325 domain-containing protein [Sphingomonas tagetis]